MAAPTVLISGIGIAGPTLAFWLAEHGFRPTLVERAPHLRTGGYVIDFWGSGYDVAERMGILPALQRLAYDIAELRYVDGQGRRVGGFGVDVFRNLTAGRYLSVERSALSRLIYEQVADRCEARFGDSVVAIDQDDHGVSVEFAKGAARRFDLLVGADGLHSAVRGLAFGRQDRFERYLGYSVGAFDSDHYGKRDERVYVSYGVPGKQAARFALRDQRTMFLLIWADDARAREPLGLPEQEAILHRVFDRAGWECEQILDELDRCDDLYFDRVSQIRMERWSQGRVALLGDAAFSPSLLAGQGAALAMAAAYVMAGELAGSPHAPAQAFARHESLLRPLIEQKQASAERFAGSFAPRTQAGLCFRNLVTKAFTVPAIARWAIGRDLLDNLQLPAYRLPGKRG